MDLPQQVLDDIFSRLPINSLLKMRYVQKSWVNLIKDTHLAIMHHYRQSSSKNPNPTSLILSSSSSPSSTTSELLFIPDLNNLEKSIKFTHIPLHSVSILGSCNGLICLTDTNTDPNTEHAKALVCSPLSGTWLMVKGPNGVAEFVGFGYSHKCNKYKVFVFTPEDGHYLIQVLTLGTTEWRDISIITDVAGEGNGCYYNGYLHWFIRYSYNVVDSDDEVDEDDEDDDTNMKYYIMTVDVDNEIRGKIPVPCDIYDIQYVRMGMLKGYFMVADSSTKNEIHIWLRKDSWNHVYTVKIPGSRLNRHSLLHPVFKPLAEQKDGGILIEDSDEKFYSYDPITENLEKLTTPSCMNFEATPCVGTLVKLTDVISFSHT